MRWSSRRLGSRVRALHVAYVEHFQVLAVSGELREAHSLRGVDQAGGQASEGDPRKAVRSVFAVVEEEEVDVGSEVVPAVVELGGGGPGMVS
jgi:hypothetical protein